MEEKSPPSFKKKSRYSSFTLKQAGYSFQPGNKVTIMGREYKYCKSRPIEGTIKTVTVKRNTLGEIYLIIVTKQECSDIYPRAGKAVGVDFGLKHFLNLDDGSDGMKRLWGRKVSDLAFAEFVAILEWVAGNAGSAVVKIDRWMPSSKACHICGTVNPNLMLKQRSWTCACCHTTLDRDVNAAINIKRLGLALLGHTA